MLRSSDLIARYGGEEFVALLPETTSNGAMAVAKRCLTQISNARIPHDSSVVKPYVTVSIGAATVIPSYAQESTILVEHADACLYQAKSSGRNCIQTTTIEI